MAEDWTNKLYFGDNLGIMRDHIPDESVDLIYLDPPFNSKATYNVLYGEKNGTQSAAQITAFEDTWHWGLEAEAAYHELVTSEAGGPKKLADLMQALRGFLGTNDMMAYLTMMAIRLVEMHRVLKPTGSIYLHCDPTASHYIKMVMDAVFGARYFQNEIVWCYRSGGASQKRFARKHDTILFYSRTHEFTFKPQHVPYVMGGILQDEKGPYQIQKGKRVDFNPKGALMPDWWELSVVSSVSKERLGYPTQKPEALLERIIKASSNEGDLVMDPFCGCGTTVAVAERLHRRWMGIDITHLAVTLMRHRLAETFKKALSPYEVIGDPKDLYSARALAEENRYQFEWWALGLVDARPAQDRKKGADAGVDGYIYFFDDKGGKAKTIIVQVKSGSVNRGQIATLKGDMEREDAVIGAFITLQEPTRPMREEAAAAGFFESDNFPGKYPRVQILTIEELLEGRELQYPSLGVGTFKKAQWKGKEPKEEQKSILE